MQHASGPQAGPEKLREVATFIWIITMARNSL
jgi:hypothetical protein